MRRIGATALQHGPLQRRVAGRDCRGRRRRPTHLVAVGRRDAGARAPQRQVGLASAHGRRAGRARRHHAAARHGARVRLDRLRALDAVAQHGLDARGCRSTMRGELGRVGRGAVVRAGQRLVEREVLLDHRGAQRDRGQRGLDALAVVRVADRQAEWRRAMRRAWPAGSARRPARDRRTCNAARVSAVACGADARRPPASRDPAHGRATSSRVAMPVDSSSGRPVAAAHCAAAACW